MKRQTAETGIKSWDNADLIALQAEPLRALDGFFAEYGPCIVQGCDVAADGAQFDISPGLVVLSGKDHKNTAVTMIVPFAGVSGTSLPLYLTLAYKVKERVYGDGQSKPIEYEYYASPSTVVPTGGTVYFTLSENAPRFVDAVQNSKHRFITDAERANWNARETTAGAQAKADKALADAKTHADSGDAMVLATSKTDASTKADAVLRTAKEYTNTRESIVRANYAEDDATVLRTAKTYADQIVTALVDGSPEALNTLKELAVALGNDPNFATTVMQMIGERVTTEAMNAKTDSVLSSAKTYTDNKLTQYLKWDVAGWRTQRDCNLMVTGGTYDINSGEVAFQNCPFEDYGQIVVTRTTTSIMQIAVRYNSGEIYWRSMYGPDSAVKITSVWRRFFHAGNLGTATASADGLMTAADKQKLDGLKTCKCCGQVSINGTLIDNYGCTSATKLSTGKYRVYHNIGHTRYAVVVTITRSDDGNTYDNTPMVATVWGDYFDVWIGTDAGKLEDTGFYFITMPFYQ